MTIKLNFGNRSILERIAARTVTVRLLDPFLLLLCYYFLWFATKLTQSFP